MTDVRTAQVFTLDIMTQTHTAIVQGYNVITLQPWHRVRAPSAAEDQLSSQKTAVIAACSLTFSENVFSPCIILNISPFQEKKHKYKPCSPLKEKPDSVGVNRNKSTQFSRKWSMALFPPRPACCTPSWPIETRQCVWAEEQMKWAVRPARACVCDSKSQCVCVSLASL